MPPTIQTDVPPAPSEEGRKDVADVLDVAFPDLDEAPAKPEEGASKPSGSQDTTQTKKASSSPSLDEKKPTPEPAKKADAPAKPAGDDDEEEIPKFTTNTDLRKWAKDQKKRARTAEVEISKLTERLKFLESTPANTNREESAIKERLATLEKQLSERDGELKLVRYERSQEYKDKYQLPYTRALGKAYSDVKQLLVETSDAEGNVSTRNGTDGDFAEIYQMPLGPAWRRAKELFGDAAGAVMNHRENIQRIASEAQQAIEDHRTNADQIEKEETARRAAEGEGIQRMWRQVNDDIVKRYPKFFAPEEGDDEGNRLLDEGFKMVDSRYNQADALTVQQRIILDARIRNQAAAFSRVVHKLKSKDAEIDGLKKQLDEFKASEPGKPKRPTGTQQTKSENESWESAIDNLPE